MNDALPRWIVAWRHWLRALLPASKGLCAAAAKRLEERIALSEARHSGEICVYVERSLPLGWLLDWAAQDLPWRAMLHQRALAWFGRLKVWDTEHNNGVLIYLQMTERAIEIVADRGIDRRIGPQRWQALLNDLALDLKAGRLEQGLGAAVDAVGAMLEQEFPMATGQHNPDELPNTVHIR